MSSLKFPAKGWMMLSDWLGRQSPDTLAKQTAVHITERFRAYLDLGMNELTLADLVTPYRVRYALRILRIEYKRIKEKRL